MTVTITPLAEGSDQDDTRRRLLAATEGQDRQKALTAALGLATNTASVDTLFQRADGMMPSQVLGAIVSNAANISSNLWASYLLSFVAGAVPDEDLLALRDDLAPALARGLAAFAENRIGEAIFRERLATIALEKTHER